MRILVTGGTGFLGSAFVRLAQRAGHELAVLSRTGAGVPGGARWLPGSVAEPPWPQIEDFAPDACVHAAWIATPGVYLESPENEAWVKWSFDFLTRLAGLGVRHVTVLGTCIEYRITGKKLVEDGPIAPMAPYSCAKGELHWWLSDEKSPLVDRGLGLAWARVFYPYGEGEHPARLASSLIAKLRRGESVSLKTPRSTKDYIHVEDLAAGLLAVVERRYSGAINLGTGEGVAVEAIARELGRLIGRPELIQVPENPPADPLDYVVADAGRLRGLGWKPQVTLAAGLRRLVEARAS
jgi:dTDP-6-deoxy-L-talose 4-dehydrogenase (NAD+)